MRKLPKLSEKYVDPRPAPAGVGYMDGQYLPMNEVRLPILDNGLLHSDATYDVVHVWKGAFFRLDDHLDRFFAGMKNLRLEIPYTRDEVKEILHNCVALSGLREAYVEFICTRGLSKALSRDPRDCENRFIVFVIPFVSVANTEQLDRGMHLAITDFVRIPPSSVNPTVKNYHWLDLINGLFEAYDRGAENALLLDLNGHVSEGPGFNIFLVKNGEISTPKTGVLLGVTRQTIIDICSNMQIGCHVRDIAPEELLGADEVFVTSTAGGVMPVSKINGKQIGSGSVGAFTKKISLRYWRMHQWDDVRSEVDYLQAAQFSSSDN